MRKLWFYLAAIILIGAAAAAIVAAIRSSKSHVDSSSKGTTSAAKKQPSVKDACSLFTLTDAKQLLGDTAKGGQNPITESTKNLKVTTCTYTQDQGANAPVSSRQSATLLVRAPLTDIGKTSNQNQFGPLKPTGVQDVPGYGDSAYWDPEHGQLNILKSDTWYILSYGPTTPASRTLDQTKQLADLLINKL
jgi:hypothetical protein